MIYFSRIIISLFILSALSITTYAFPVSVDENIEFISAACRLAGFDEYSDNMNKSYTERLDSIMHPYSEHPSINFLRDVRKNQGIGYDAIAALAVHTDIDNGHLILKDGADVTLADDRWRTGQDKDLLPLLDDLYQSCNFTDFYKSNAELYSHAVDNAQQLLSGCDLNWLNEFYGKELSGSRLVLSLLNRGNYGMTQSIVGKPDKSVIIICCRDLDEYGYPIFTGQNSLIVHESSHPICNPLVLTNINQFNNNIELAAELMEDALYCQSYSGGTTMMCESMVRSVELQYAIAHNHDDNSCENYMRDQMSNGFIFMPEIRAALETYNKDRNTYPVIDSIMPLIISNVNNADVASRYAQIKNGSPKILGCSIQDGATNIEASDSLEIKFYFDQPIRKGSFGMNFYNDNEDIMPELADISPKIKLSEDGLILHVYIQTKPGKEYGFTMNGNFYRGLEGYRGHGNTNVHFFTKPS